MEVEELQRGQLVSDAVTGIQGYIDAIVLTMHGNAIVRIQPHGLTPDGGPKPTREIDANMVDFVSAGLSDRARPLVETDFTFGDEVQDVSSGFKGVIVQRVEYLNGCVYFVVKGTRKDSATPHTITVEADNLKKIGVVKQIEAVRTAGRGSSHGHFSR